MAEFLFRLWVHQAEDGLLPEVVVNAENKLQAAALALQHFVSIGRPIELDSYLQCEPSDGEGLRVRQVLSAAPRFDPLVGWDDVESSNSRRSEIAV